MKNTKLEQVPQLQKQLKKLKDATKVEEIQKKMTEKETDIKTLGGLVQHIDKLVQIYFFV